MEPFRLLHTSDWHLGQNLMGKSRQAEHEAFIAWLVDTVNAEGIHAVIVAGDIFDTGAPPSYARALYNQAAEALADVGCELVLVAGNHDSVAVLAENQGLLKRLKVHVIPAVAEEPESLVVPLHYPTGEVACLVCALPFIRPRDLVRLNQEVQHEHIQSKMMEAIQHYYQAVYEAALAKGLAVPIVGTGHLTTFGAQLSESVRDIYVGSLAHFPVDAFPPFDYLALGHIHRAQAVGGTEHIRYSGSPIALSFDELGAAKQVLKVSLNGKETPLVQPIEVPQFQPMRVLKGNLAQLRTAIEALPSGETPLWVELQVEEQDYLSDLHQRIAAMVEGKSVEVLRIRRMGVHGPTGAVRQTNETLEELQHGDVFSRRLSETDLTSEQVQTLTALYEQVVQELEETP